MATNNINININLSSFQALLNQLITRLSHLSVNDLAFVFLALLVPPLAVLLKVGFTLHFWINVVLTIMGIVPGQIHALWVVLFLK